MSSGKKYFGTDGIRGVAGQPPLDPATVRAIGLALAEDLRSHGGRAVLIGEDTRESSRWIAETLAAALAERGLTVASAGVLTTPGVAYLTRTGDFVAGVMISASHNPYQDNGIKVFDHSGFKLPDEDEAQIEAAIERFLSAPGAAAPARRALTPAPELRAAYLDFLASRLPARALAGWKLVVDCGHGAASALAADLFGRLGAELTLLNAQPDGRNINRDCGALHPTTMAAAARAAGADAGVALDGDADRAILADAAGELVDGDRVLYIAARDLRRRGELSPATVVGTVMSNLGLEVALRREGIELLRAPVGDKYVLEKMTETGAVLGGEQSGHVIFRRDATTGDGLLTALRVFEMMAASRAPLADLAAGFAAFPQQLRNVRVREKIPFDKIPAVRAAIAAAEAEFAAGNGRGESAPAAGRVLVRYSGTESLARVMVEAASLSAVERHCAAIAAALEAALGERQSVAGARP